MGRSVLFVDDERSILKSLERLFFYSDIDALFAHSGAEGLKILGNQPIDIVVSDMKMPEMDGHQFLRQVKKSFPGTTRIILSGYASENELFESIIDGSNSLYLLKPWKGEELKTTIEHIFAARDLYRNLSIFEFANKLENLSMIPGIYNSVSNLIEQDADISAIANVIEGDPTVTASVLRVVNSAFYNIKTASITQAITFLSLPVVKSIVLSCGLLQSVRIQVPHSIFSVWHGMQHGPTCLFLQSTPKFMDRQCRTVLPLPACFTTSDLCCSCTIFRKNTN